MTLLDRNRGLLEAAERLAAAAEESLRGAERINGDLITGEGLSSRGFDLVIAAYALTELADAAVSKAVHQLWARCTGLLVIVEPGRTRDYRRLMAARAALIAAGGRVVAPCPHDRACPLPENDWCHFSVRLPRSRAHRQAKGGTLGYEDEKFSYLIVARPEVAAGSPGARVIRPPELGKADVALALCTADGLERRLVPRRDVAAYKVAKKLDWGDGLD